jgi:branched-chain amino acid transport system substrate-binding protein
MGMLLRMAAAAAVAAVMFGPAKAEIKIGVAGPMTGPNAGYGQQYLSGVRAAADKINGAGGVLGEKLVVVTGDEVSDPKQGVTVGSNFVADGSRSLQLGRDHSGLRCLSEEWRFVRDPDRHESEGHRSWPVELLPRMWSRRSRGLDRGAIRA